MSVADHQQDNNLDTNHPNHNEITISVAESFDIDNSSAELLNTFYSKTMVETALTATLDYIAERTEDGVELPYFADMDNDIWQQKPKALDIYITDAIEGRELNLEARGKDYATNILSYPSEMPASIIELMPTLPLGELIICHEVMVREADEQNKTIAQHITHLLIHGMLHLLGFDHEIGAAEQDEMECFEIDILAGLGLANPYL